MLIRQANQDDYEQVANLQNIIVTELHETSEKLIQCDKIRNEKIKFNRFVAEINGIIVAEAHYSNSIVFYHPQKFEINIVVLPEYQHQGIGTALYNKLIKDTVQFNPIQYHASTKDNSISGISFLEKNNFTEIHREQIAALDVRSIDISIIPKLKENLLKDGIVFKNIYDLKNDINYEKRLYELEWELVSDIPFLNEPLVKQSFDEWYQNSLYHPEIIHDAYHVAVKKNVYIGYSYLWGGSDNKQIHNGMTGVINNYRGRNIAYMLKMLGVNFAIENNYISLLTSNSTINKPIIKINEKIGYKKQYDLIEMIQKL